MITGILIAGIALLNFDLPSIRPESEDKCTDCHGSLVQMSTVHPPAEMKCGICHASTGKPHPGDAKGFTLTNSFPAGLYAKADADTFALCWDCHDMDMILVDSSTAVTGFRNGALNLHSVHIRGDKGRSCSACHNVHAASNRHLVRDKVKFGNWSMPMNYIVQDEGGSCAPGCHGVKEYKR